MTAIIKFAYLIVAKTPKRFENKRIFSKKYKKITLSIFHQTNHYQFYKKCKKMYKPKLYPAVHHKF